MRILSVFLALGLLLAPLASDEWRLPDDDIAHIFNARRTPACSAYPEQNKMLMWERPGYMPLEMLAWPVLHIAGRDITPGNNALQRSGYITNPWILDPVTGDSLALPLPPGAICGAETAAPDGHAFFFNQYSRDNVTVWLYDFTTGELKALVSGSVNQAMGGGFQWLPDNRHIIVSMVDPERGDTPQPAALPAGPDVYETTGEEKQLRTFPNLIDSDYDEMLYRYYLTVQYAIIDTHTGKITRLGEPGVYMSIRPSPNGEYYLVYRYTEISRRIPWWGFASQYELWTADGDLAQVVQEHPTRENVPNGGVLPGPRSIHWHPYKPMTLVFAKALDGGDPKVEVPFREQIFEAVALSKMWTSVSKLEYRWRDICYLSDHESIFYEYDRDRRWSRATYVDFKHDIEEIVEDISTQDVYNDPGWPMSEPREETKTLVRDRSIYMLGSGFRPDGMFPFIDRLDLDTFEKERLWQSPDGVLERFEAWWNNHTLLLWRSSPTETPNMLLYDTETGERTALTDFVDDAAVMASLPKRFVTYEREDGVELSGMLYLPPDWDGHTRLPLLMTAYPEEYTSAGMAGQARNYENGYTRVWGSSPLYMCLHGYAVLQGARIAIVGDPETVNETFIEQVVSSAQAAIDYLDAERIIDPARTAVQGHSYGAFMVANLLAHSDIFSAGIAQNGAYNRTLTPFGFQSERRTLWQAKDLYLRVSPLLYADQIDAPLLLIHSQGDTNPGTYPMQSKRLFEALDGLGKHCRYLELPLEEHGYSTRETHLHLLAEYQDFLDKHLKPAN